MAHPYRGPLSPRDEPQYSTNPLSPPRNPNRLSGSMVTSGAQQQDVRGGLTRRFTTNGLPTLSPIGQQRKQAAGEYLSELAARQYEVLLARQRALQAEIDSFDPETRRDVEAGLRHEDAITQMLASSEPASPPDYGNAFPTAFSKPNRYSAASLTSPPGISNRPSRSSTQVTSPSVGVVRPYTSGNTYLPSQSVPGSRRQSDNEDDDEPFLYGFDGMNRSAANPNRNSMPITGYDRNKRNTTDISSLGPVNTTGFLFDNDVEDNQLVQSKSQTTSPPTNRLSLQVQQTPDGFPKLIRADQSFSDFSASAALDLALAQGIEPQTQLTDRATASRHRISLPPSALTGNVNIAPLNSILANADSKSAAGNRRSMEVKFTAETKRPSLMASPPRGLANGSASKLPYSTNDIPTLKSINGTSNGIASPRNQHINPIASTTSVDQSTTPLATTNLNRHSQEFIPASGTADSNGETINSHSSLQANAAPFGPTGNGLDTSMQTFGQNGMSPYAQQAFYSGHSLPPMHMLNNGFGNMSLNNGYGGQTQWANQQGMFAGPQNGYGGGYSQYGAQSAHGQAGAGAGRYSDTRFHDNQRMNMQQRRQAQEDAIAKYSSVDIEELMGEIYSLCKDQHGCRFLQRKLDERDAKATQAIFDEVKGHIVELMTDPFGNYLCQKLLECTDDDQRTVLIRNSMGSMTKIALNQHGTRALQKMIEYISTPEQTECIIQALRYDVVQLIQDLNGNHVIQKCLNHLTPENAQFIFDAAGQNCIDVGTHRHGCCVLQRCIDHASGAQKGNLVDQVINNAFTLVQDPFGNYVVQYIIDLAEPSFTEPLCRSFYGHVALLSKQKFSSNVIEKCIRCAGDDTKRELVREIYAPNELDKLLRDSFANYVVQTAIDHADEQSKAQLINNIRPILPHIRNTPYGRRIQLKITDYDTRKAGVSEPSSGMPTGYATPDGLIIAPNGTLMAPNGGHLFGDDGNGINGMMPPPPTNGLHGLNGLASPPLSTNGLRSPHGAESGVLSPPTSQANLMSPPGSDGNSIKNLPLGVQSDPIPSGRGNRRGWAGPPPAWRGPPAPGTFGETGFSSMGNGQGLPNGDIASPAPQRHNYSNSWFEGNGNYGNQGFSTAGRPPRFGGNQF
ncbi:hypothetical protein EJ03DRAFT_200445 [Teratosphaeria nubilosa]|uniref:PUM-HD domain-containing protein n=1 Tax=Teratosphaeria nubilosa TaxID=161662 RepID=A0A6G1LI62_9PEZI|nr:hypothetical protein EJ03DRAFT_200445 [Teratosphaeria nubilosa]